MLSFMKDEGLPQSGGSGVKNPGEQEQEYLTVAVKEKNVRKSTWMLCMLFILGLMGLLLMIKQSGPRQATAADANSAESKIEMAIERLTGIRSEVFGSMDEVVTKFNEFSDVQQVEVEELVKNPFYYDMLLNLRKRDEQPDENIMINEMSIRRRALQKEVADLQLLSIMRSIDGNCCMINDSILYEGDMIRGFKIGSISEDSVTLICTQIESDYVEIILKLEK